MEKQFPIVLIIQDKTSGESIHFHFQTKEEEVQFSNEFRKLLDKYDLYCSLRAYSNK